MSASEDQLAQARAACERHLKNHPADAGKWLELAAIRRTQGDLPLALDAAERARGLTQSPQAILTVAQLLSLSDRAADAYVLLADLSERQPAFVPGRAWLGITLLQLGRTAEAAAVLREVLALDPANLDALTNLASLVLAQGGVGEALALLKKVHEVDPNSVSGWLLLARTRLALGDALGAERCLRTAEGLNPALPAHACFQMAGVLQERKAFEEAETYYRRAVALDPATVLYRSNYAEMLRSTGRIEEGLIQHADILKREPDRLRSHLAINLTLPGVYADTRDLMERREDFAEGLAALRRNVERFRALPASQVEADVRWSNYLLAYQGEDDRTLQAEFAAFQAEVLAPHAPSRGSTKPAGKRGDGRLRIGFASSFFYNCTVGWYFSSWMTDLDPEKFHVHVYSLGPVRDELTRRLAQRSEFRQVHNLGLFGIANQVLSDDIDILIFPELGLCPITFALAAMRLAPLQCTGWGHPVTSGHANVDLFLSCQTMEPPEAHSHYTERLCLLPGLGTRYPKPMPRSESMDRRRFGLPEDVPLALLSQSLFKVHPENDELIRRVLEANPTARLVLFEDSFARNTLLFKQRLAAQGIPAARTLFLPYMPRQDFLAVNQVCDVMLDTLRWSGGNTSLDAIAAGLPVVTLPGQFMRGRQSMAMLRSIGCSDLIASDKEDYVRKASVALSDVAFRHDARERMRAGSEGLYEQSAPLRHLEETLTGEWRGVA